MRASDEQRPRYSKANSTRSFGMSSTMMMSSYRSSYLGPTSAINAGDEVMDDSHAFHDEVTFGSDDKEMNDVSDNNLMDSSSKRGGGMNRSMVDIFLQEDESASALAGLPMPKKDPCGRSKQCLLYGLTAVIMIVIFMTVPGALSTSRGVNADNENNNDNNVTFAEGASGIVTHPPHDDSTISNMAEEEAPPPHVNDMGYTENNNDEDNNNAEDEDSDSNVDEINGDAADNNQDDNSTEEDTDRSQALHALVLQWSISDKDDLETKHSAASRALEWIAMDDKAALTIPDTGKKDDDQFAQVMQRYALACFYFSMESVFLQGRRRLHEFDHASPQEFHHESKFDESWGSSHQHVCEWFGVTCNDNYHNLGRVTAINLTHTLLEGRLPREILAEVALPELTSLDLSHNALAGTFPSLLSSNNKLTQIHLEHNQLQGNLDELFSGLKAMQELDVTENQFTGSLPKVWATLSNLETLRLGQNQLEGSLPAGLADATNLQWLQLDDNEITGSLPDEWKALTNLQTLKLAHNKVQGSLPDFLGNDLSQLQHISLQKNVLTGTVPASLAKLTTLEDLHLQYTELTGTMPKEVCLLLTGSKTKLITLTADCKEPDPLLECSCCTTCY